LPSRQAFNCRFQRKKTTTSGVGQYPGTRVSIPGIRKQLQDSRIKVGDTYVVVAEGSDLYTLASITLSPEPEFDNVAFEKGTGLTCQEVLKKLRLINNVDIEVMLIFQSAVKPQVCISLSAYQQQLTYVTGQINMAI
jgi:hypothetical protein